jgi:type VI secretion system secreted protein VgrG
MNKLIANSRHNRLDRLARSIPAIGLVLAVIFSGMRLEHIALAAGLAAPARGLGSAANFLVLGGSTVTNTGATVIAGELGTAPGTTITGFPPGIVTEGGTTHMGDALALQAQSDATLAYNSSAGQACNVHLADQELGGKTLTPDVYCFPALAKLSGQLVLDAQGNAAAIWIIQIPGGLSTATGSSVVVTNGGGVCNVFWIVGESATIGAGSSFAGNILALTSVTMATGASLSGRAMARNGAVTLDSNTISKPPCAQAVPPTPVPAPAHVSVEYQCAADGRVIVSVGLTAGVLISGLGADITSSTGTGNNPIVRYLAPGHYEWRAIAPAGAVLDIDHGVVEMPLCSAIPTPTLIPTPAPVPTRVPVAFPDTGANLEDAQRLTTPQMMSVSLGFLSLGLLSLGMGLIVVALRRK